MSPPIAHGLGGATGGLGTTATVAGLKAAAVLRDTGTTGDWESDELPDDTGSEEYSDSGGLKVATRTTVVDDSLGEFGARDLASPVSVTESTTVPPSPTRVIQSGIERPSPTSIPERATDAGTEGDADTTLRPVCQGRRDADKVSKDDLQLPKDDCLLKNGGCEHSCITIASGYFCECDTGYTLSTNSHTCQKLNTDFQLYLLICLSAISLFVLVCAAITLNYVRRIANNQERYVSTNRENKSDVVCHM